MPLRNGKSWPQKTKDVKQIKETKRKKKKKKEKWDKKDNKDIKDLWSKKKTIESIRKLAYKMEDAKNIRFGTLEQKQAQERTDKEYWLTY